MGWIRHSAGRHPQLGPLETRLLGMLSQRRDATVRELLSSAQVDAAYTTVMTTLDRLYKKGFLDRSLDAVSRAFRYRLKQGERHLYLLAVEKANPGRLSAFAVLAFSIAIARLPGH